MQVIRFATYLAPSLYETYRYIARSIGEKVGQPTTLTDMGAINRAPTGSEFAAGEVDVGFICGLPYVNMADAPSCPVELLAAPVLRGERYQQRPVYFSDVVVRRESVYTSFEDLHGCRWAYNQKESHSGWNMVCYSLLERGKALDYFGELLETGSHQCSIARVLDGQADATAVDSQVLEVLLASDSRAAAELRILDMLGPSSIPPVVIARRVDQPLKHAIAEALLAMHNDPLAASALGAGAIERFVQVRDEDYRDIRRIRDLLAE
jgi:phosphonate transport system substrate-binding protein